METTRRLVLVLVLIAAAALPAAATALVPPPRDLCEPTVVAIRIALFCAAPYIPTKHCCLPVVAAVDHGGGVPCLCRVAAEPRLVVAGHSIHLLTLYTSCGGVRHGGATDLAAACEGEAQEDGSAHSFAEAMPVPLQPVSPPADRRLLHPQKRRTLTQHVCNPMLLAELLIRFCGDTQFRPAPACCLLVIRIIEDDCLCLVTDELDVKTTTITTHRLWLLYGRCGGKQPLPTNMQICQTASPPPPPPPPPPAPPAPATERERIPSSAEAVGTKTLCIIGGVAAAVVAGGVLLVLEKVRRARAARDKEKVAAVAQEEEVVPPSAMAWKDMVVPPAAMAAPPAVALRPPPPTACQTAPPPRAVPSAPPAPANLVV